MIVCFRWISQFALVDLAGLKCSFPCRVRAIKHIGVVLPHDTSLSSMLTGLAEEHTVLEGVFWPTRTRCISCRREVVLSCTQWVAHSSYQIVKVSSLRSLSRWHCHCPEKSIGIRLWCRDKGDSIRRSLSCPAQLAIELLTLTLCSS